VDKGAATEVSKCHKNWALVLVATVAALIAYLQWVTAHQRVVVDLLIEDERLSSLSKTH